jgi:predicted nucleic acid-binding protein|uniref:type II toxin-antitoxin system VapC family toxin n=1 Tax=Algoriphagus sp. TaxID=1872435 RepID=UPI002584E2A7|nr:type II toxin-antitoxin system VapC family toxin [Algoriphagus sp.]
MVWDTNSIIFFLQDLRPKPSKDFLLNELRRNKPKFSIITEIELLSWKKLSESEAKLISGFLFNFYRVELSEEIKEATIQVRRTHGLKVPDAIIAASALILNQPLLTHNLKDFKLVKGLEVLDPMSFEV